MKFIRKYDFRRDLRLILFWLIWWINWILCGLSCPWPYVYASILRCARPLTREILHILSLSGACCSFGACQFFSLHPFFACQNHSLYTEMTLLSSWTQKKKKWKYFSSKHSQHSGYQRRLLYAVNIYFDSFVLRIEAKIKRTKQKKKKISQWTTFEPR